MSVDVEQVGQFLLLCHNCWGVPLRIVLTMVFLWKYLGPSSLATLATMFASTLATTCVAHFCDKYQVGEWTLSSKMFLYSSFQERASQRSFTAEFFFFLF